MQQEQAEQRRDGRTLQLDAFAFYDEPIGSLACVNSPVNARINAGLLEAKVGAAAAPVESAGVWGWRLSSHLLAWHNLMFGGWEVAVLLFFLKSL